MSTDDKILYAKVGVSFVGALVAVLLLVWLFGLIFSGSGREDIDQAAQDRDAPSAVDGSATSPRDPATPAGTRRETVLLVATGDVTVQVRETTSNEVRFRGSLTAGQEQTVEVRPPMLVQFTNGENLQIEFRGERVAPSRAGAASIRLPAPE